MSAPDPRSKTSPKYVSHPPLRQTAMWVGIGALIAAALVCVVWVLVGSQNGLIGRAFLTILLLAAFAGAVMLDAKLASRRPEWFALTSMLVWVATLLIGAFLIWAPDRRFDFLGSGVGRFGSFLLIVLVLQGALLHVRLFTRALERHRTPFTTVTAYITMGLVALLALMLVLPLMLSEWIDFHAIYWRLVVAVTILAAVGTAIVALVNAILAPRRAPAAIAQGQVPPGWPTFVDAVTPLPVMPDGSPDWNAYYTGYPSAGAAPMSAPPQQQPMPQVQQHPQQVQQHPQQVQQQWPAPPSAGNAQAQWPQPSAAYQGYPPPPPLPPA